MDKHELNKLYSLELKVKNKEPMSEEEDSEFRRLFKSRVSEYLKEYKS